eukprot:gene9585-11353_t
MEALQALLRILHAAMRRLQQVQKALTTTTAKKKKKKKPKTKKKCGSRVRQAISGARCRETKACSQLRGYWVDSPRFLKQSPSVEKRSCSKIAKAKSKAAREQADAVLYQAELVEELRRLDLHTDLLTVTELAHTSLTQRSDVEGREKRETVNSAPTRRSFSGESLREGDGIGHATSEEASESVANARPEKTMPPRAPKDKAAVRYKPARPSREAAREAARAPIEHVDPWKMPGNVQHQYLAGLQDGGQ